MGPIAQILEMLPGGMGQMAKQISPQDAEKQLKIDRSDHQLDDGRERRHPDILNASRRRRIATRLWHRCTGCQPLDQAVSGSAAHVQND